MTREEQLKATRAAVAEAGYDPNDVELRNDNIWYITDSMPPAVAWTAGRIVGCLSRCWPCFESRIPVEDCDHDPYTSERPRLPVRT